MGDELERDIGFKATEEKRLCAGWDKLAEYHKNAQYESGRSLVFTVIMISLNLLVVCCVVFKQQ